MPCYPCDVNVHLESQKPRAACPDSYQELGGCLWPLADAVCKSGRSCGLCLRGWFLGGAKCLPCPLKASVHTAEVCWLRGPKLLSPKGCLTRALVLGAECREAAAAWSVASSRVGGVL